MATEYQVIFRVRGDRRRYRQRVMLGASWDSDDVAVLLARSLMIDDGAIIIVGISPSGTEPVRADAMETAEAAAPHSGGPTRRKLISTDTLPEDWPRSLPYLEALIKLIHGRRSRAIGRGDLGLAALMGERLALAKQARNALLVEAAAERSARREAHG